MNGPEKFKHGESGGICVLCQAMVAAEGWSGRIWSIPGATGASSKATILNQEVENGTENAV